MICNLFIRQYSAKKKTAGITVIFRTSNSVFAEGDTLDEVLNSAIEEARTWIQVELEDTFELPPVTHPNDLVLKEGEFVRSIAVTIRLTDGWDE